MKLIRIFMFIGALLYSSLALAQQQSPQRSPMEQALSEKLGVEIGAGLQATATIIDLQRQLAAAQAKLKELEPKVVAPAEPPTTR